MSVFVHAQGIKLSTQEGGGSKNGKILSTQLLNAPYAVHIVHIESFTGSKYTHFIERMRVIEILFDIEIRGSKSIDSTGRSRKHITESRPLSAMGRAIERLKIKKNTATYKTIRQVSFDHNYGFQFSQCNTMEIAMYLLNILASLFVQTRL